MNIFVLDLDPVKAAQAHADKHCIKLILESAQLLCSTMRLHRIDYGYKTTHANHPCRLWLDKSADNFNWLKCLALELCKEYTFRYGKTHKSQAVIAGTYCPEDIKSVGLTPFAQAMPDEFKNADPVKAYRAYYRKAKKDLLQYTNREKPEWILNDSD